MSTQALVPQENFAAHFAALDAGAPLGALRAEAFEHFTTQGMPTMKHEEWRYTSIKPIAEASFVTAPAGPDHVSAEMIAPFLLSETPCHELVFINGRFASSLSEVGDLPEGVVLDTLAGLLERDPDLITTHLGRSSDCQREPFTALNTALIEDGVCLHLPREARLERPVHLVFLTTRSDQVLATHPRILVIAEAFSEATIIETYGAEAEGEYFTNTVTEIIVAENATIDHYKIERDSDWAFHVSSLNVEQASSSNFTSHNYSFGGRLVRNHVNASLNGEGIDTTFNGLVVGQNAQHVDNHLRIDHLKPLCNSWEYYKTILDDRARGVFSGRIYVAQDAQKTDAKQTSMNLLLSEDADVTTKPQLEIFADDVKCTHGATIGQIEESQLFYLKSRGIDAIAARSLLIYAFANETISEIRIPELRQAMEHMLMDRLPQGELLRGGL